MRKITFSLSLIMLALFYFGASAQVVESFDNLTADGEGNYALPTGWAAFAENVTLGEVGEDGGWTITKEYTPNEEGLNLKMYKYMSVSDCWVVTPQFTPTTEMPNLLLSATTYGGDFGTNLEVFVSTSATQPTASTEFVETAVVVFSESDAGEGSEGHKELTVDLSAYVGQKIYVGLKVHNFGDPDNVNAGGDNWWLDDFKFPSPEALAVTAVWERNVTQNTLPSWYGGDTERGLALGANGHLYVVNRTNSIVKILNAATGEDIGELDMTGVTGGTYTMNDIEVSEDGTIFMGNLTVHSIDETGWGKGPFTVYKWSDESATPEVLINYTGEDLRLGDKFTVIGDINTQAFIYAAGGNSNKVVRWEITGGVASEPVIITCPDITDWGTTPSVSPVSAAPDADFIVNGVGSPPSLFASDGTLKGTADGATIGSSTNAGQVVVFEEKTYYLTFNPTDADADIFDITNGIENAILVAAYPSLGAEANINATGDVALTTNSKGELIAYIIGTNNGLGAYKIQIGEAPEGLTALWEVTTAAGSLPSWFGAHTERGLATAPNGHLYVVNRVNAAVKIMDALTGAELGQLDMTGVTGGTYTMNDIEVSDDGTIFMCNLTLHPINETGWGKGPWTVYKWNDENAAPEVLINYTGEDVRLGDKFSVVGDINTKAYLYAAGGGSNKVLRWEITGGVAAEPVVITCGVTDFGTTPGVAPLSAAADADFIVNGQNIAPTLFAADGTLKEAASTDVVSSGSNAIKVINVEGKNYFVTFRNGEADAIFADFTNGLATLTAESLTKTMTLGEEANTNATGDVDYYFSLDGKLYIYVLGTNNGIGVYQIDIQRTNIKTVQASGGDFATMTEAVNFLNGLTELPADGLIFLVKSGEEFAEDVPAITATGTASQPIVFTKNGDGANPIVKSTTDAGIKVEGGDYFTFDCIDISAAANTLDYGYYFENASVTDGAQHNTIQNCTVTLDKTNSSSVGIMFNVAETSDHSDRTGSNSYNLIKKVNIQNVQSGILIYGYDVSGEQPSYDINNKVTECIISNFGGSSSRQYGIRYWSQVDIDIANNVIKNGSGTNRVMGIYSSGYNTGSIHHNEVFDLVATDYYAAGINSWAPYSETIHSNKIYNITNTTDYDAIGIQMTSSYEVFAYNNMIWNISAPNTTGLLSLGIYTGSTAEKVNIFNNTILLNANITGGGSTAGIQVGGNDVILANNIIVNKSTVTGDGKVYGLYLSDVTALKEGTSNNLIFADAIAYDAANSTQYASIDDFKAVDANAISEDVPFMSSTDLHLKTDVTTEVEGGGAPIASVATDIDGDTRNAETPDIGADEGDFLATNPPVAPVASNVNVEGTLRVESTVTGTYTYKDDNEDAEGASTYKWYIADDADGTNKAEIADATAKEFVLTAAQQDKYVAFEVTPINDVEPTTGVAVMSGWMGPIGLAANKVPTAEEVSIKGDVVVGNVLRINYTFKSENEELLDASAFQWYIADDAEAEKTAIEGATGIEYSVKAADQGKLLFGEVTPIALDANSNTFAGDPVSDTTSTVGASDQVLPLERLWVKQAAFNTLPTWFTNVDLTRGFAAGNGKVYVASRAITHHVRILDAATGVDLGMLSAEGISGGTYHLNSVEMSDDGQILACNLAVKTGFKIYKWTDDSAVPEMILDYANADYRLGDNFSVVGDVSGDAKIYAADPNANVVLIWSITGGTLNDEPQIVNTGLTLSTAPSVYPVGADELLLNGHGLTPTIIGTDGTLKGALSTDLVTNAGSNTSKYVELNGKKYIIDLNPWSGVARIIDITSGIENVTSMEIIAGNNIMGTNTNGNGVGDLDFEIKDGALIIYVLGTNNGLGAYKLMDVTAPAAADVAVNGNVETGVVLQASYTYTDGGAGVEGNSIVTWKKNGEEAGMGSTYLVTADDLGATFAFDVIPVAEGGYFKGAMVSSAASDAAVEAVDTNATVKRTWVMGENTASNPTWSTGSAQRGFAVSNNGHMYVATREGGRSAGIKILDASNGAFIGWMKTDGISSGLFAINDVDVTDDGQVISGPLHFSFSSEDTPLNVYKWADETAEPELFISWSSADMEGMRIDMVSARGDFSTNSGAKGVILYAAKKADYSAVIRFLVSEGVAADAEIIPLTEFPGEVSGLGTSPSAYPLGVEATDGFIVNSDGMAPTEYDATGKMVAEMSFVDPSSISGKIYTFGDDTYYAAFRRGNGNKNAVVVNITDGVASATEENVFGYTESISEIGGSDILGDVDFMETAEGLHVFVLATNYGISASKMEIGAPAQFVSATTNGSGSIVEATFNKAIADPTGNEAAFVISEDGTAIAVTAVALKEGDATTLVLTLASNTTANTTLTLSYTPGTVTSADGVALPTITDAAVTNISGAEAPVAANVVVTGTFEVDQTLEASFDYSDANGDEAGTHLYQWYYSESADGSSPLAIVGEKSSTYTITSDMAGKYIAVKVTPVAATGGEEYLVGAEAWSAWSQLVVVTGISTVFEADIKMYPVPVSDILYISNAEEVAQVKITNVAGQTLKVMRNSADYRIEINVSELTAGIYFVTMSNKNGQFVTEKIVKK